ncbi:MAG: porin family protein [Saprospiraceae bacterium]|nr:porin family protein [Saprospiraceae bacterium]
MGVINAQLSFGIKAGLNLANINYDGEGFDPKILPSFHAGPIIDFGITENIGIGSGLIVSGKGFKLEEEILGEKFKSSSNPIYLQVPVTLNYSNGGFFAAVGPYVGFGLFGNAKNDLSGKDETEALEFGNTVEDDYSPLDFGASVEAGFGFGAFRITASYGLGLANIFPKDTADFLDDKATHNVIGVSAAYLFGK